MSNNMTVRRILERVLRNSLTWEVFYVDSKVKLATRNRCQIAGGFVAMGYPWKRHPTGTPKAEWDEDVDCALWRYWKENA